MTPPSIHRNAVLDLLANDQVCVALGCKIFRGVEIVHIAKSAGYDNLFVDLEHSTLTIEDAGRLCLTALSAGITPVVRVPYECGAGFVQKVLDAGAMAVIFPHIDNAQDAKKAVQMTKFPPAGIRSITGALPHFNMAPLPPTVTGPQLDQTGSAVLVMIESGQGVENVEEIVAVPGVDIVLVGPFDLASDIGTLGDWEHPKFITALEKVGRACVKAGKHWGFGGIEHKPELMSQCVNEWGARWILGQQDFGLLLNGGMKNCETLKAIQTSEKCPRN